MKKATLLLFMLLVSLGGYAQLPPEGFEGSFPPTGWSVLNLGGPNVTWEHSQLGNPDHPHTGAYAAYLNRENVPDGQQTEDWLITKSFPAPANPQLRFWSRLTINGNQGTTYQVRVSTDNVNFTIVQTWTEAQLNPSQQEYVQKLVTLPTDIPVGQQMYVAFVMMGDNGDRWLIDDVSVDQKCLDPTNLTANNITQTSANLSWGNPSGATSWEIEIVPVAQAPTGTGIVYNGALPYPASGLAEDTDYKYYVRALCSSTNSSEWVGPYNFGTVSPGATCEGAIQVTTLPYTVTDNTSGYGDDYNGSPGATGCGSTSSYLNGDDVVYSYTPTADGAVNIGITGNGTYAGLFVYNSCANIGVSCIAGGVSGSSSNPVSIPLLSVTAGTTYYIVISTWAAPQSTPYTLTISNVECPPPTNLSVSGLTSTSADLSWAGNGSTSWEIVVQNAGTGAPAGAGTTITDNTNYNVTQTTLGTAFTPSTAYEYYVRAACSSGTGFSTWTGPFVFNTTQIPATLNYVDGFEGTPSWTLNNGSQTNKWVIGNAVNNGGTQSLYISNNGGAANAFTITSTSTVQAYRDIAFPANVNEVSLRFDWRAVGEGTTTLYDYFRVWLVPASFIPTPGTQITAAASGGVQIGGSFNQNPNWVTTASYVINASAFAGQTRRLVFEWRNDGSGGTQPPAAIDNINLSIITCSAPSAPVASNVQLNTATLSWTPPASAVAGYDYYYSTTNTAPTDSTTPNGNVSAATVDLSGLTPSTNYFGWVRSNCGADGTSFWVGPVAFNTPQIPGTLDYTDGFEGTPLWTILNGTQVNKWIIGNAVSNGGTQSLYITNNNGASNAYTLTTTSVVQAYRDIALPADVNEVNLSFDWRAVGEGTTTLYDYFRVWVVPTTFVPTPGTQITAANSGGTQVGGSFNQNGTWTTANYVINASASAGQTRRLIFEWRNDGSGGTQPPAAIDNINISVITCSAPTNLVINNLTENSATLSWTAPAVAPGSYEYYYSTTNTPPTAATVPLGSVSGTTTTVTVPGLSPNTQYYFWVRSNCGATDGNSFWTPVASFVTPQIPATITYNEGFEGTVEWALNNGTQTNKWVVGTAVNNGGTQSLYISNNNGAANAYTLTSTSTVQAYRDILFPAGANEVNLSFDWRAVGEGATTKYDYFRVWLVPVTYVPAAGTLITAGAGRVQIGGSFNQNGTWTTATYPIDASGFDGEIRRLVFEWRNDGGGGTQPPAAIDNISLVVATCPRPINVESSCASSTSANFTWEQGGSETSWEIALLPATAPAPASGTIVTNPLYYAENLTPNTAYTFYVRSICTSPDEVSLWVEADFTTFSSSVLEAEPFCASQNEGAYILFDNVYDSMNVPEYGDVACLGSTPNPVWYYLQVEDSGVLNFQLIQNTAFNAAGNPTGTGLDVDFVAFGPFNSLNEACGQIVLEDCPTCPNNTTNQAFYPFGNIIDCSFSAAPVENFTIPNAQEGEIYAVLITNYNGDPGQIKLQQLASSTGNTNCNILYSVELGNNQSLCNTSSTTITATVTTPGNSEAPSYEWFMDGEEYTPTIVGNTPLSQTISVSEPGIHVFSVIVSVANAGNTEPITDEVTVIMVPDFTVPAPATVNVCGATTGTVDLTTLTSGILGTLNPADYVVEYYPTQADATAGTNAIDISVPFVTPSQTIYVRVESAILGTCFEVVPLPIVVNTTASATITYADSPFCSNELTGAVTQTGTTGGTYTSTTGLVIDGATGTIDIAASTAGIYTVTYTTAATEFCPEFVTTTQIEIVEAPSATIAYANTPYCSNGGTATVTLTGTTGGAYTSTAGLVIDPATGDIDLGASTAGTYTVTYTVGATAVCADNTFTTEVTITELPTATIAYGGTPYCSNGGTATVTQTGAAGGTYSSATGLVIDAATGEVNLAASTAGTYTVTYTIPAGAGCPEVPVTASITITALPSAVFSYDSATFCKNFGSTAAPTFAGGAVAGAFTVDLGGLTIDPVTGVITPATSQPGQYTVTNTIAAANGCGIVTETFTVTIIDAPVASFTYSSAGYCQDGPLDPSPMLDGAAGTFAATPAGLSINSSTGVIDLSASQPGIYTVTNTVAATSECAEITFGVTVVINATPTFVFSDGCVDNVFELQVIDTNDTFNPDNATYVWTGPAGFTPPSENTSVIEPNELGDYSVMVTTAEGCISMQTFTVNSTSCFVQRGISPGDGVDNEAFDLTALNVVKISIFNRYGQEVFSMGNYTNQWVGQDKSGNELPTGTYFYSFERANGETKTGWIYVNRQN